MSNELTQARLGKFKPEFDRLQERLNLKGTYGADAETIRMAVNIAHTYLDVLPAVLPNLTSEQWRFFASAISKGKLLPPRPKSTGRPHKKEPLNGFKVIPLIPEKVLQSED